MIRALPAIVYAGSEKNICACTNAVVRSTDADKTWLNLTVTTPLRSASQPGGPHEVQWIRVHPLTHEAWATGQCLGWPKAGVGPALWYNEAS